MELGVYEIMVRRALEEAHPGPWSLTELDTLETTLNDDFCAQLSPECRSANLLDWLRALSPIDRQDLLDRLNESREIGSPSS